MIAKILHAVWLGPRAAPTALLDTWRKFHPDFEVRLHTNEQGWENQAFLDVLDTQPRGAHLAYSAKSDIIRFELLVREGGIYVDMDTECVARLPDWLLNTEAFGAWENEADVPGWIASCVLGARKNSSLFRDVLAELPKLNLRGSPAHVLGPGIVTRHASRHPELEVLSSRAFCPHYYNGVPSPAPLTDPTYALHHWGGTAGLRRDTSGRWLDHPPVRTIVQKDPPGPTPLVTVAIPCYGQAKFLSEAVASVRAQTERDYEIVVAAGDSASVAEAKRLGLRWLDDGGKGLSHARNVVFRATRGRYLLPLDADDLLEPTFLERLLPYLDGDKPAIVCCRVKEFGASDGVWNLAPFENLREQNALPSCALYPRTLWEAVGGYDTNIIGYEDWDFWLRCFELEPKVTQVSDYLFRYRVHDRSLMRWDSRNHADAWWRAMIRLRHPSLYDGARLEEDRALLRSMPVALSARLKLRMTQFPHSHALRVFGGLVGHLHKPVPPSVARSVAVAKPTPLHLFKGGHPARKT